MTENHNPVELTKLKEMLMQRDNEISVLVKMLKKEKKRTQDAVAQLMSVTNGQRPETQSALKVSAVPAMREKSMDVVSERGEPATHHRKT
ncbi:hypothetical protein LDENG_00003320, partial [Lucifuga dentata]